MPRLPPPPQILPTSKSDHLRFSLEAPRENQLALFVAGGDKPLSKTERTAMLERLKAGEHIELEFEAVTFIQRDTPNRNFVRFQPGALPSFAKSFAKQPFLMNHDHDDVSSRGGTILSSKLEHNDDGSKSMRMRVQAVKPWAVEGLLDGTIDRFSISWDKNGASVLCSLHELSLYACDKCWIGRADKESGKIAEVLIKGDPIGTEMSSVNVPAVVGTSVVSMQQLSTLDPSQLADILGRDTTGGDDPLVSIEPEKENAMKNMPALAVTLGLLATATEDEIMAAAQQNAAKLQVAETAAKLAKEENERLAIEETKRADAAYKLHVDNAIAQLVTARRILPGDATELALRTLSSTVFDAQVASLLKITTTVSPVGAPLPALTQEPGALSAPSAPVAALSTLNVGALSTLRKHGYTDEQINKHSRDAVELIQEKELAGVR